MAQQQVAAAVAAAQGQQASSTQQPQQVHTTPAATSNPQIAAVAAPRAGAVLPVTNLQVARLVSTYIHTQTNPFTYTWMNINSLHVFSFRHVSKLQDLFKVSRLQPLRWLWPNHLLSSQFLLWFHPPESLLFLSLWPALASPLDKPRKQVHSEMRRLTEKRV